MRLAHGAIAITVLSLSFAAVAQQPVRSDPQPPGPAPAAPRSGTQPQVDESALRYFAAQGDTRRVNAEIARLRALYPNWTPPSDLSQLSGSTASPPDPIIQRLWTLYKEDRIGEIRSAIAERQASNPDWKPPQDLLDLLVSVEARRRLVNASDSKQWRTVLSVATETPALLTCANVDVLWRVAEAFARTDQQSRTQDVYIYLLTNCTNPAERLATLQKALELLPEPQVTALLRYERKNGHVQDDFGSIRDELARRRVEGAAVAGKAAVSPEDLAVVERLAQSSDGPDNVLLLGWYHFHHDNPAKALEFFKTALDRKGGNKAAEGYAMALRALNRLVDAEGFAYEWRDKSPDNMKVYLDVATALLSQDPPLRLDTGVVARTVSPIAEQRFVDGAQALGWYSYNTGQFRTAREWFRKALGWKPDDEPSAYGAALSSQRLNDLADFRSLVAQWKARSERIADLANGRNPRRTAQQEALQPQTLSGAEPPVRAGRSGAAPQTADERELFRTSGRQRVSQGRGSAKGIRNCMVTRDPGTLSADAALTLGWCLMEANRPLEAVPAFDRAIRAGSPRMREEAAYGKSLAYLRKDLTAEAAIAATQAPLTTKRSLELNATILAQRAVAAYRDGRYVEALFALSERAGIVPDQTDLMLIRGWCYFKLGRYDDAEKIFRAVQRTGYSEEAGVGLNAVLEATKLVRF